MKPWAVLVLIGVALLVIGLVVRFAPWLVSWFGRLPGDIRIEGESTRTYIPIMSMIVISLLLSGVLYLIGRIRG